MIDVLFDMKLRCAIAGGQISNELIEHYHVQGLEDVRVIRDRQTSMYTFDKIFRNHGTNFLQKYRDKLVSFGSIA